MKSDLQLLSKESSETKNFIDENKKQNYNQNQKLQQYNQPQSKSQQIKNNKANKIINKCLEQHDDFLKWYQKKSWQTFHSSHYDWWAFPIDQLSGYGDTYKVDNKEIQTMKNNKQFIQTLSDNARMVCEAWGYDLMKGQLIKTENKDQKWHNWPIRLYKMTKSLQIFELRKQFQNALKYGNMLIKEGKHFTYNKRELSKYFVQKWKKYDEKNDKPKPIKQTIKKEQSKPKIKPPSQNKKKPSQKQSN